MTKPVDVSILFKSRWGIEEIPISSSKGDRMSKKEEKEMVNHPDHYGGGDNIYETIKIIEATSTEEEVVGFCKNTALRYLMRAKSKYGGKEERQDYKKAEWYINRMNEFMERNKVK